ncbi:salivary glue protein Sgs-3-like [Thrips palmi]|uniref:Salivary glue protein Sgs-3-like n=1 Tax=Thrips palmi TaxID=161013 RepID=A0A6P8YSR9_THRPL|nr:salivary glue protein Sgs-3-like [Thrips palmi]
MAWTRIAVAVAVVGMVLACCSAQLPGSLTTDGTSMTAISTTATSPSATSTTATLAQGALTMATSPSATSPSATSPSDTSPTATSMTATSAKGTLTTATSPSATSPSDTSPTATSMTATSAKGTLTTATSPSATSPTATSPTATSTTVTPPSTTSTTATSPTSRQVVDIVTCTVTFTTSLLPVLSSSVMLPDALLAANMYSLGDFDGCLSVPEAVYCLLDVEVRPARQSGAPPLLTHPGDEVSPFEPPHGHNATLWDLLLVRCTRREVHVF